MANYQIIRDEKILADFISWLPELREGETYYLVLLARNKYVRDLPGALHMPHIRSDKQQLARLVTNKTSMRNKIKQLETGLDNYFTRDGEPIPEEALALYISVNPRSHVVAARDTLKMLADYLTKPYDGYRLDQDVISNIQRAIGNKVFMDLDFDGVDLDATMTEVYRHINSEAVAVLKTRGGFHLLVRLSVIHDQYKKSWYKELTKLPGVDVRGDNLIPVPGTTQGGFMPFLVKE